MNKRDEIDKFRENLQRCLGSECERFGNYKEWYRHLEEFRKIIRNRYMQFYMKDKLFLPNFNIELPNGHVLDHHLGGYISPLDFVRTGWGGGSKRRVSRFLV